MFWRQLTFQTSSLVPLLIGFGAILGFLVFFFFWRKSLYKNESSRRFFSQVPPLKWSEEVFFSLMILAIWLFATFSMMDPAGNPEYARGENQSLRLREWLFLLDTSASMEVSDGFGGHKRLENAKEIIFSFLPLLRGALVGVQAFTSEVIALSPPTLDHIFVSQVVTQTIANEGGVAGTDLQYALNQVAKKGQKNVVLLTDGGEKNFSFDAPEEMTLFVLGLGSLEEGKVPGFDAHSKQNRELLSQLGGIYLDANSYSPRSVPEQVLSFVSRIPFKTSGGLQHRHYFQIPLGIAILLLLVLLRVSRRIYA